MVSKVLSTGHDEFEMMLEPVRRNTQEDLGVSTIIPSLKGIGAYTCEDKQHFSHKITHVNVFALRNNVMRIHLVSTSTNQQVAVELKNLNEHRFPFVYN